MKYISILILLCCGAFVSNGQLFKPFKDQNNLLNTNKHIAKYHSVKLDSKIIDGLKSAVQSKTVLSRMSKSQSLIDLPTENGGYRTYYIAEVQILSDATAKLYPDIKTYDVQSLDAKINGRVTIAKNGVRAMLLSDEGRINIEPASNNNAEDHIVFAEKDNKVLADAICGVKDEIEKMDNADAHSKTTLVFGDCALRTYNLAIAATGEYTALAGSQANAIAAITATVANISFIYERDLAIKFTLVTNNSIVFTSAGSDPYPTVTFPDVTTLNNNTTTLNTNIGSANYDLGMVLNDGWSGGLAYTPGICSANKGGSASGVTGTTTGSVLENVAAHEIGHLFSANHTMSAGTDVSCANNLNLPTAYEIGGGSSIMAYAGAVCVGLSYQNNTDNYFHYNTLNTIITYAQSQPTCGTATVLANTPPTLTVPATTYNIPISTPFELTANATDLNGANVLAYSFDQYDVASTAMTAPPSTTATTGPMFRSYPPSLSNTRVFPPLTNILNNSTNTWEVLPSVTRALNFKAIVRDQAIGGGCIAQENIVVNVNSAAGPFAITSNNTAATYTFGGSPIALTWSVAGTTGAPVNSANVDVLFSTDGGQTFPHTLLSNTPNDGSQSIVVPNLNTYNGRIKVKSSNNIFFDINNAAQTITSSCTANGSTFSSDVNVTAPVGSSLLNLGLTPNYGTPLTISGTLAATDPATTLSIVNVTPGNCITFSNQFRYDVYSFQVNVAGSYTFTFPGSVPFGTIMNLYQDAFNPANTCNNFISSNAVFNGTSSSIGSSITVSLIPFSTYVMAVGTFDNGTPVLPSSYSVTVTAPATGGIYSGTPNPGTTTFSYKFAIVNSTTNNIVAINSNGDMTNTTTFPPGNYVVYGLSHANSVTTPTLNSYVGGSFNTFKTALLNNTICGNLSSNSKIVIVDVPTALDEIRLSGNVDKEVIKLKWNVIGAKNMDRYEVEKSVSGSDFTTIGIVKAGQKTSYLFDDNHPENGNNLYRIKAIDKTSTVQYSNMIAVPFTKKRNDVVSLYPNPAKHFVTISTPSAINYDCMLTDVSGKVVSKFVITNGLYNLPLKNFSKGVYFLHGKSKDNKFVEKLVVE